MKSAIRFKSLVLRATAVVPCIFLLLTDALAAGAQAGWSAGSIIGLLVVTGVMFRIHPVLGSITLFAGLVNLVRMFS